MKFNSSPEFKKSIVYLGASTTAFGLVFIQNFSIAYFVSVEFFGRITLAISLFSMLYVVFTFGLNAVVLRFYFDKKHGADKKLFLSHIFYVWSSMSMSIALLLLTIGYLLLAVQHRLPIDYLTEFVPILFGAVLFSFTEIFSNFFIADEKPLHYAVILIASRATIFVLLHISIFFFPESPSSISLMLFFSGLILAIIGVFVFRILPIKRPHWEYVKEILVYAFPLMIYALGGIGYSHGYRVVISNWLSYQDLGVFSFINQIVAIYYLTASSSVTGFYPKAYKALEENHGQPKAIKFYLKILSLIGLALALPMIPAAYLFLAYFKGGIFFRGVSILPVLLLGQFIYFIYGYNYILCTFYKKTNILTYAMLAGVSVSLSLAMILKENNSLWRAALPVATGIFVQFSLSAFLVRRIIRKNSQMKLT